MDRDQTRLTPPEGAPFGCHQFLTAGCLLLHLPHNSQSELSSLPSRTTRGSPDFDARCSLVVDRLPFNAATAMVEPTTLTVDRRQLMGDRSPKSKERGQKQKDAARATGAAKAAAKRASQSQVPKTPTQGKR